jgi:hypothetical protein
VLARAIDVGSKVRLGKDDSGGERDQLFRTPANQTTEVYRGSQGGSRAARRNTVAKRCGRVETVEQLEERARDRVNFRFFPRLGSTL